MKSVEGVSARVDGIVQLIRVQTQVIALVLLAVTPLAPLAAISTDEHSGSDELSVERLRLTGLVARMPNLADDVKDLVEAHPYAAPGGLWVTGIGMVVLVIGLLATAAAVLTSLDKDSTSATWLVRISLIVLVVGALLVAVGLAWFPEINAGDDERGFGPSWGLWIPLVAAIWIGIGRARLVDLT